MQASIIVKGICDLADLVIHGCVRALYISILLCFSILQSFKKRFLAKLKIKIYTYIGNFSGNSQPCTFFTQS